MTQYLIKIQELIPALAELAELFIPRSGKGMEGGETLGVKDTGYYRFAPWDGKTLGLNGYRSTRITLKELLFPESESLYRYRTGNDEPFVPETVKPGERVVLGARPCDCAALSRLDSVFMREPVDDRYDTRRKRLTIIGLACTQPAGPSCFCTSVGLSPESTEEMDIRATILAGDNVLLEPVSQKGEALINKMNKAKLRKADKEQEIAAANMRKAATAAVRTLSFRPEALDFESPLWRQESASCLGCGTCTFLCPTCHCFTIEQNGNKQQGRVYRSWDSCQFPAYTLEASGFNPRPNKEDRMRQRILHKFKYFPESHDGTLMCVGCGRCVQLCPAGIDLRDILVSTKDLQSEANSHGNK
jgi:sulfhydrogenase subunit beta (sulfur reductase)